MPPQILLFLILAVLALVVWLKRLPVQQRKRALSRAFIIIGVVLLIIAIATGRLHWLFAVLGGAFALIQRLSVLARSYTWFKAQSSNPEEGTRDTSGGEGADEIARETPSEVMDKAEAYAVLGLKPGARDEEITAAYRRLMQRVHPDRGGSGHLAEKIIRAKKILLTEKPDH